VKVGGIILEVVASEETTVAVYSAVHAT